MALSDFMPYGAPELLDGSDRRLLRSTFLASSAVALLFPLLGLFVAKTIIRDVTIDPPPIVDTFGNVELLPPPPAPTQAPPGTPIVQDATPVPVPDIDRTVRDLEPAAPVQTVTPVSGGNGTGVVPAQQGHAEGNVPQIGEYVPHDVEPEIMREVDPVYPDLAREAGIEGVVRVLMLVGLDGRIERAVVAPHGSVPLLDEAALAAARASLFSPALADQHPVRVWVARAYRFTLHPR
jgi:protein TonB